MHESQTEIATEDEAVEQKQPLIEPPVGSLEWILYWGELEGHLPSPINISITGSIPYKCPPLKWYNFDVYPHKIKLTNTGYTLFFGAKWMTERPYVEGGPFLEKMIFSHLHFHWGANFMEGSDHYVDSQAHPGEMQVTFFKREYMTLEESLRHKDGVVMFCYLIKYGVKPDPRLQWLIDEFPAIREAQTSTRVPVQPLSKLIPMFHEDYFLYWGTVSEHVVRFLVPRIIMFASFEQMNEFRRLWDPWDEPLLRNYRVLQEHLNRHVFLINPHWNMYNSLLPVPRIPEESISILSPTYLNNH